MKKQHGYLLRQQGQSSDSLSLLAPIGLAEHSQNYSFHSKKLSKDLTKIQSEEDEGVFRTKLLNVLKKTLTEARSKLAENLYENHDGAIYVGTHAMIMDQLISTIHRMILSRHYEKNKKKINGLSILAVG